MSNTLTETVASIERVEEAPRKRAWTRWLKALVALVVAVWVVDFASPVVIAHTPLQSWLTRHLETAFGRPVDVGSYSLSLWGGPAIEARAVTVTEDARFGNEYFLRAEALTMRVRLRSLFLGKLELGTLSLSHPSLNLVRNAEGDWNLAEWLPRPGGSPKPGFVGPAQPQPALRIRRLEVDSGRINFKRGDEKLPYAFANVSGFVESQGSGRWRIDLGAVPSRAAVIVQQPGMLHLSGELGGTSSRLRPATLALEWQSASISDVLRIARGYDYGVRGNLALVVNARTEASAWLLETRVDLTQAHRWDLAARPDNPAVSLHAKINLDAEKAALVVDEATLDTANSQARGNVRYNWNLPIYSKRPMSPFVLSLTQGSVDLGEMLSWARAFRPSIADDVSASGLLSAKGYAEGWPPHMVNLVVSSNGASLNGKLLRAPVKVGAIQSRYDHGGISLMPVAVTFGPAGSAIHAEVTTKTGPNPPPVLHLNGNVAQVRDLIAAAGALGWSLSRGWDVAGPMRCDLRWQSAGSTWNPGPTGYLELGEPGAGSGASLRAPFINQPLEQIRARAEIKPGVRHVALTSAEAFGSRWNGTLDHFDGEDWRFAVSADHLAAADLDRWLNPRWRQGFLDRVLPFLNSSGPTTAVPENLRARGRLSVEQFALSPILIRRLNAELRIDGRSVQLSDARGEVYGGNASGDFDATLAAAPAYRASVSFSGVSVAALSGASPAPANSFGGIASGELSIEARGDNRADLMRSLTCEGSARVRDAEVRGFDLIASLREGARRPGKSSFGEASGAFACADGRIQFDELRLAGAAGEVTGSGSVDFNRNLNLQLRVTPDLATPRAARASYLRGETYELTGPLAAPEVRVTAAPAPGRQ